MTPSDGIIQQNQSPGDGGGQAVERTAAQLLNRRLEALWPDLERIRSMPKDQARHYLEHRIRWLQGYRKDIEEGELVLTGLLVFIEYLSQV